MKTLYYILHYFTGCNDEDLDWYKNLSATCRKCGRVYFNFKI